MRSHNAGDAWIEKRIDAQAADIRHRSGHGEPKAIFNPAHLVNRLRREQSAFIVRVDKIEAAEHADDFVFLKYLVRSKAMMDSFS